MQTRQQGGTEVPPIAALVRELPDYSPEGRHPGATEQAYLDYYLLDFSNEYRASRYSFGTIQSGVHRLALQSWQQEGATNTLLLVHGLYDHVGLMHHLIRFGLQRGCNVVAFDLPGHGLSSGEPAVIEDFADYRHAIADVLCAAQSLGKDWQLIGQSTGGAAIMDYLNCGSAIELGRVVLLAPLVRPRNWRRASLAHRLLKRFKKSIRRTFAENSNDARFLAFLRKEPLQPRVLSLIWLTALKSWLIDFEARAPCACPLFVVQGDADGTVDWEYNLPQIKRLFPATKVYMLSGGRHHLANESRELRSNYLEQVSNYLDRGALPE